MLDRERWFISRSVAIILLFILCLFALFARFCTGMERSSTNRSSFETKRAIGSRSWSRDICYYLSIGAMILLFVEKVGKVLRTFFFCKTKVLSFRGEEEAKFFYWKPWTNIFRGRFGLRSRPGSELLRERINLRWQENRCTYTHRDRSIEWTPAIVEELRFSPTHHQRSFF